jgi:serine/threonine-protein kinase
MEGAGDYVFLREIGRGPHGRVFLARTPPRVDIPDRQVAVKVLLVPGTDEGFDALSAELGLFADVGSPRLLALHDVAMDGGTLFYAMRHQVLGSLASPTREVPRRERLAAVARAAHAAHELHEAGIVHRAIKPSNILLDPAGAVLAEPAVAHLVARGQPLTGLSTRGGWDLELVDPALMKGGPAGRASDIWALGVTLHLALTGYGLYPALVSADPMVAVRMFLRSQPEPDADLSDGERAVVVRALQPDPGKRYETADEMGADIEQVLG